MRSSKRTKTRNRTRSTASPKQTLRQVEDVLRESAARFRSLTDLSSDWFWEQDAELRFTRLEGRHVTGDNSAFASELGKTRGEIGVEVEGGWEAHRALLEAHQPFRDAVMWRTPPDGQRHYMSVSGEPMFDGEGRFIGYRGVGKNITERKRGEQLLALEHTVTRALAGADSTPAVLTAAIRAVCEAEGWECGRYFRPDEKAGVMRFTVAWGVPNETVERFIAGYRDITFAPGVGLIGRVWQSGQPLWVSDLFKDDHVSQPALTRDTGMHCAFIFPVISEGKTIGVFAFNSREIREPDERLLQAISVIGSQVGQFVQRKQAEEVLRESEERFRAVVDSANEGILVYDRSLHVIGGNAAAERIIGLPLADIIGAAGFTSLLPCLREDGAPLLPEDRPARITIRTGSQLTGRILGIKRSDGSVTWLSVNTGFLRRPGESDYYGIVSTFGDVTVQRQAETALRESEGRFRSLTNLSSDLYWEQDEQYRFTSFAGIGSEQLRPGSHSYLSYLGKKYWKQHYINMTEADWAAHIALLDARQPFRDLELCRLDESGNKLWVNVSGEPMFDPSGAFTGYRGVGKDITSRKNAEERIQYLATHDGLTDLPNRVMFSQVLNLAIASARRYNRHFAVLFIDLDRFKIINDTLGHEAGDALLKEMSRRIKDNLRSSDLVARLGGDEFVVLVQEVTEPEQVAIVALKLLSTVIKPVVILGQECRVTASIGISMYPADAQDEQALMKNADVAMYLAKEEGKNNFQFYSKEIKTQSLERLTLETSLRQALEREELFLHYQAKLDLKSGAITGVEALVRWQHPDLGLVPPLQFIPLAEETGLIVPIGKWVLQTACAQNVAWRRAGLPPVCMAVNLSPRQFADENLLSDLAAVLQETGIAPELLEIEITESMVMGNVDRAARQLTAIKGMGVRLAINDFGTGYSSLAQIKRFQIDTIKVDRSFIREIPQNAEDRAITEAIIAMGKSLSLTVVAEVVETEEQQTFLREHACDEMQGFYFSKPVAPEQFAELLRRHVKQA